MDTPPLPASGTLPVLPLRAMVLFPGTTMPVDLGRPCSVEAVRAASKGARDPDLHNLILVATQRDSLIERPRSDDLHPITVVGRITQILHGLPGRMTVLIRGLARATITDLKEAGAHNVARFQLAEAPTSAPKLCTALAGALLEQVRRYESFLPSKQRSPQREQDLEDIARQRDPAQIADMTAAHLDVDNEIRIPLLLELDLEARLRALIERVSEQIQEMEVKRDIDQSVRDHLTQHEHEAVLRHKLRAIQAELGDENEDEDPNTEVAKRLKERDLTETARVVADRELDRLSRMNPQSGEANTTLTYVNWLADLPWGEKDASHDVVDIDIARQQLSRDHHGLATVKKRVLEYLSVRKLAPNKRGPILCFGGPPGVGKTSLARSIAAALGRKFVRISLGGVRDDAEIRGHRRTYVGAQPGRLLYSMKKAGTSNPVILLDELDKIAGPEQRGDPAAALLEALDPEQNEEFEDHYLSVPYDLSKVIFICTANDLTAIPGVLRDRLEIIRLTGYTVEEKLRIAREHLLPREMAENGLKNIELDVSDEALLSLATEYTRESGVRNLQRALAGVLRHVAMQIAETGKIPNTLDLEDVRLAHGPPRYLEEMMGRIPSTGVVTGLGWTASGGCLLFVEATTTPGQGKLRLTGSLGDVMKESGTTALSLVRSGYEKFGLAENFMQTHDIHVHFPAGAVPKDGPSAGIAVTTAIISALSQRKVRHDVAMTGEVTLRGRVLPVGGIREKVLAAHRAGIREIILPARNKKDEVDIPETARRDLTLHYVHEIDEVLAIVLAN